jgi:hypothetical protein
MTIPDGELITCYYILLANALIISLVGKIFNYTAITCPS